MYDAIVVLGGSFIDDKTLPTWVESRLNTAIQYSANTDLFLLLSRGSPHKPPVLNESRHPIDECQIMANYLIKNGVEANRIILDAWSKDTIGNAYATLTMHAIPRNLRKMLIITSDFHMPRTQAIFEKVFSLFPLKIFELEFLKTKSELSISNKEVHSLMNWMERENTLKTLSDLHEFIFTKHDCYNVLKKNKKEQYSADDMKMYCV